MNFNGNMTLALANNPTGATLGGTLTVTAVNGEATFYNLTIDKLGSGYTLTAANDSLTSATSDPFDVTISWRYLTQPPSSITAGITFAWSSAAEDGNGNVDTSYQRQRHVDSDWQTLRGTTTVTAVNGVATFSNLILKQADSGEYLYGGCRQRGVFRRHRRIHRDPRSGDTT